MAKKKKKSNLPIWLGGVIGGIFGLLSPFLSNSQFINSLFLCPRIAGTPQYFTQCVGDFYLGLFGLSNTGGGWGIIPLLPLIILIWALVGSLIGLLIKEYS